MPHNQLIVPSAFPDHDGHRAHTGALSVPDCFAALGMGPAYVAIVCLYVVATR